MIANPCPACGDTLDPVFIEGVDGWMYRQCLSCGSLKRTIIRNKRGLLQILEDAGKGRQ